MICGEHKLTRLHEKPLAVSVHSQLMALIPPTLGEMEMWTEVCAWGSYLRGRRNGLKKQVIEAEKGPLELRSEEGKSNMPGGGSFLISKFT